MDARLAIYPTARKVEDLLRRESRRRPLFDHRAMTFPQLVDGLWRECARSTFLLPAIGERLALEEAFRRRAVVQSGERLPHSAGLIDCLQGLVGELKRASLTPEDLREAARVAQGGAAARVLEIAGVFGEYQALLAGRNLADSHDRERIVLDFLLEHEAVCSRPQFLDGVRELLVAEIYDFSLLQFMIVAALIRLVGDARLTIQAEPHIVDVSRFAELTWNRFVAEESIADKVLPDFVRREGRPGQLGFVLQHLFAERSEPSPPPDRTIRVIEAPSRFREVEEVGREIRRALEEDGGRIALGRVAILARDLSPYAGYLERIFERYHIPLRMRRARPIEATAPAKLALQILSIPLDGYRREALDSLLASPLLTTRASQYRSVLTDVGYMDRNTRSLADCISQRRVDLAAAAEEAGAPERERLARRLADLERAERVLGEFLDKLSSLEESGTVREHAARLRGILADWGFEPSRQPVGETAKESAALDRALEETAGCADLIAPNRRLKLKEFDSVLRGVLSQTMLECADGPLGGVQALEVLDARGLDFDLVFILGLDDGSFPIYHSDDPLLHDDLREVLNRTLAAALRRRLGAAAPSAPGKILRTRRDRNSEDWFLFFLGLSTAEREVVLTYPAADESGRPLNRSPFVSEVLDLLGSGRDCDEILRRAPEALTPEPRDCFAATEFLNRAASDGSLDLSFAPALGDRQRLAWINRRIEIERSRQIYLSLPIREFSDDGRADARKLAIADRYVGRTRGDERLRRALLEKPWNTGRLNDLAACGFKFFSSAILNLREDRELEYESSALETGSLAHRVLKNLLELNIDFTSRDLALQSARRLLERLRRGERALARDPAFFDLEWRNIERMVEEVIEFEVADRARRGEAHETLLEHGIAFTLRDRRPVGVNERTDLALRVRLDRLELYRDRAGTIRKIRVLDYKTSRDIKSYEKSADPQRDRFGLTDFQLPVYLMAALEELKGQLAPDLILEAGYLVLRHRKKLATFEVPRDRVEIDPGRRAQIAARGEAASAADRAIELAASAIAGEFDVDPLRCDEYCPFRRVCRYEKPRAQP